MNNRWRQRKKIGNDLSKIYQIPKAYLEYPNNFPHNEEIKDQFVYKYLMTLQDARRKKLTLEAVNSFIAGTVELLKERKEILSI